MKIVGQILKIALKNHRAIVEFSEPVAIGTSVEAISSQKKTCAGRVIRSQKNSSIVDFSNCAEFSLFLAGDRVRIQDSEVVLESDDDQHLVVVKEEPKVRSVRFAGSVTFDSSTQMVFGNASGSYNSGTTSYTASSGSLTYQMANGLGVSAEILTDKKHSFGFHFGGNVEYPRSISSSSLTLVVAGQNISTSGSLANATVSFVTIYGDLSYRWGAIYVELGPNLVSVHGELPSAFGTPQLGFGGQMGGGVYLSEHLVMELVGREIRFSTQSTSNNGLTLNPGSTQIMSANLALKFIF